MVLLNPWGLLALLSIPLIIGLHFFRERKRVRRIGGLHLWEFARVTTPAGRRFDRIVRSLPLLFQLLAALLLSLLIAGLDWPTRLEARHFTIVADDSISMQARPKGASASERAAATISKWAREGDRFTLIRAGSRSSLVAGPFATRAELINGLNAWQPESPVCMLDSAMNLAAKFAGASGKVLFATDSTSEMGDYAKAIEVHAEGTPAPNAAIVFADRIRVEPRMDRVVASVRLYATEGRQATLRAIVDGQEVASQQISLTPGSAANLDFKLPITDRPVTLAIEPPDALTVDDKVILAPVAVKTVKAYVEDFGELNGALRKAVESVPDAYVTDDPRIAELVFTKAANDAPTQALRTYVLPDVTTTSGQRIAQGQELVLSPRSRITDNLALEGVMWTYTPRAVSGAAALSALIAHTSQPLLSLSRQVGNHQVLEFNLNRDATNLFRTTAWPMMVQGMVEECRDAMPGMSRTNYRTGEEIPIHLVTEQTLERTFALRRVGETKPLATYNEELPPVLRDLPSGAFEIVQAPGSGEKVLATFHVNLFAPGESDLRNIQPHQANLNQLRADALAQSGHNRLLFYLLVAAIVIFTVLSWLFQDASH